MATPRTTTTRPASAGPTDDDATFLMGVTLTLTDTATGRAWAMPAHRLGLAFYQFVAPESKRRGWALCQTTERLMLALCRAVLSGAEIPRDQQALGHGTAPVVPAGVPFPLDDTVITWGKGDAARTMAGAHAIRALAYLYSIRRGGGWDAPAVVGPVLEGLGLASELLAEQHAALAVDREDLDLILTALGAATATYAARLDFTRAEVLGLDDAMIQRATPKGGA